MEKYLTVKDIALKWNITPRRIQKLCADGKIEGAVKFGRDWAIPADAEKPRDARITTGEYKNWRKVSKDSE
ncbi:MAG: helix-turn-helix domain-containing protein [Blautia sp.]|nr:helix-turn-helix domain-containing protein [Blautia sp.]